MIKYVLTALTLTLSTTVLGENDPYSSPLADMRREASMLTSHASIGKHYVQSPKRVNNAHNYAIAIREGRKLSIPDHVMAFHIDRESGGNAYARNPKSTATGLLQPIRSSHAAIIGKYLTHQEHVRLASDPVHNARVGAAHIRACMDLMPNASAKELWRRCHVAGHGNVGGRIEMAARYFKPDSNGWLSKDSVAMPWTTENKGA